MKFRTDLLIRRAVVTLISSMALMYCSMSFSQSLVNAGDLCDVKNPAAKDIRRDFGALINIRPTGQFNVACPITTIYGAFEYNVIAVFENFHEAGISQNYRCTLTEYDIFNFRIRAYNRSVRIDSGFVDNLFFEDIRLADDLNRLHLICSLPPHSALGHVAVDNI